MKRKKVLQKKTWRCFHCDEVFRSSLKAQLHFGGCEGLMPACHIDAKHLRELEKELAKYRSEDTDLHRQIRNLECQHFTALRREEEKGYARGLRDAGYSCKKTI